MKMSEAMGIILTKEVKGFMVTFEHKKGGILESDHFPDKRAGEELIADEDAAWTLAHQFASKTKGKCVNIHVVDQDYKPVDLSRVIENR